MKSRLRRIDGLPRKVLAKARYLLRRLTALVLLAGWTGLLLPLWLPGRVAAAAGADKLAIRLLGPAARRNPRVPGVLASLIQAQVRSGLVTEPLEHALRLDRLRQQPGLWSRSCWDEYLTGEIHWRPLVDLPSPPAGELVLVVSRSQPADLPANCVWLHPLPPARPVRYTESSIDAAATAMAAVAPPFRAVYAIAADPLDVELPLTAAAVAEWGGAEFGVSWPAPAPAAANERQARRLARRNTLPVAELADFADRGGAA